MSRKPDGLNRRTVLKMSGVSLAGIGVSTSGTLAAGEDEFKRKIEESQRVKQSTQDVYRWLDYLETKGIYGDTVQRRYTIRENNGNNSLSGAESKYAGTTNESQDPYEEEDLVINISLVYDCDRGDYYAELTWSYDGESFDYGQDPLDAVGMFYKENWWKLRYDNIYDTTSTSTDVAPEEDWGFDFEGPGYSMNDYSAQLDDDNMESRQYYAGVYIVPRDEDVDPEDREINGRYAHTWDNVDIESVSVGYPSGLAVKLSNNDKKWKTKDDDDGDLLRISAGDADQQNCGGVE